MEFVLINGVRNHPGDSYPLVDVYADYISDAILGEELGFTRSWYGEHHFRPCQTVGSPILVATAVAAQTERIRVGTSVSLLPFQDPRRLAEDVAIADIISGGRFDFGIGPGSQYEEFRTFGIDPKEMNGRMWESIDWILRAFAEEEEFSHHGRYYDIPEMTFTTKPVQNPMQVFYGGFGPKNIAKAAERGFHYIGVPGTTYDDALTAAGRDPADHHSALMQFVHVADSTEKAWDEVGAGLEYALNFHAQRRDLNGVLPDQEESRVSIDTIRHGDMGVWSIMAVGTPEEVIATMLPHAQGQTGRHTALACSFRQAGMRTAETHRSMRMFAEHVMPALHEAAQGAVPAGSGAA